MAFTNDPTRAIDRVRMVVGDVDPLSEMITDPWYQYYLDQNNQNESAAAIDSAKAILSRFASMTRERIDRVEVYGEQKLDNYLKWLKEFIESPTLSGMGAIMPYAGGISKADMEANRDNSDNFSTGIRIGFSDTSNQFILRSDSYYRFRDS